MKSRNLRKPPFGWYYLPWIKRLPPMGDKEWRVLCWLFGHQQFDPYGNATASCPRAEMAEELGLTERQVSDAAGRLVAKKVLSVKCPGHNGHTTDYNVLPGHPWPSLPKFRRD